VDQLKGYKARAGKDQSGMIPEQIMNAVEGMIPSEKKLCETFKITGMHTSTPLYFLFYIIFRNSSFLIEFFSFLCPGHRMSNFKSSRPVHVTSYVVSRRFSAIMALFTLNLNQ